MATGEAIKEIRRLGGVGDIILGLGDVAPSLSSFSDAFSVAFSAAIPEGLSVSISALLLVVFSTVLSEPLSIDVSMPLSVAFSVFLSETESSGFRLVCNRESQSHAVIIEHALRKILS
jgi:hypothetical protein